VGGARWRITPRPPIGSQGAPSPVAPTHCQSPGATPMPHNDPVRTLVGSPASPGVARGPWVEITRQAAPTGRRIAAGEVDAEVARLVEASEAAGRALDGLAGSVEADGHADEAGIFGAQAEMARDPTLMAAAEERIRAGTDAVGAIQEASAELAAQLRSVGDELLAARADDLLDVAGRIAGLLAGQAGSVPVLERPSIVAADDLPPSVTATLPRDRLLGIALERGSATAHAAILARAYGIPAVVGVDGLLEALGADGGSASVAELAIDGQTGEAVIGPDPATVARFEGRRADAARAADAALAEADLPAETRDGTAVTLLANIGTPDEADRCVALGARGVGLFRTEFLFLERRSPPSEDEQVAAYRSVVEAFAPFPVTIRLLDVGGDKPIPYLPIAPEANPFLGVRALRLAPQSPELFVTQLRAAMRAAAPAAARRLGTVKVMAPMIADAVDARLLLELADRASRELLAEGLAHGEVALGVMLEIPSAVLVADSYLGILRFASLGTNDLLQYTLAADRGNPALGRYQDALHPALLRLVASAVRSTREARIELSVCGEMAGDPVAALALVGLGVRHLSMVSGSLAAVRRAIRAVRASELDAAARWALGAGSAPEVRDRFAALLARSSGAAGS
jgi:phosphoenolpyruvate-protein phosphotransferase